MIALRRAEVKDAQLLADLQNACFAEKWDAHFFAHVLQVAGAAFLGGRGEAPEAFVLIQAAADQSEILSLGTLPSCRRSGLGASLVREAARHAASHGASAMFLEVAETNGPARSLYETLGFIHAGTRPNYYRVENGSQDALILRAEIPLK
jgi:ribosomal-protein-alanine N-acetyltransferase